MNLKRKKTSNKWRNEKELLSKECIKFLIFKNLEKYTSEKYFLYNKKKIIFEIFISIYIFFN